MNAGGGLSGLGGPGASASPLGDRYAVVRELGQGAFGRTYLAKDLQRDEALCVVKEFAPQVTSEAMLANAKALFEQETSVLYQLDHEQIPKFWPMPSHTLAERLYLVQDYVPGLTYQTLLEDRQRFGGTFSETEITQLLYQLLPVLSYIHSKGVIHRDIAPDNLILRQTDGLPVLIDFGSVKNIAASVGSLLSAEAIEKDEAASARTDRTARNARTDRTGRVSNNHIGKVGYASPEQMRTGEASPSSDLYALAATLLTLATGEDAEGLGDVPVSAPDTAMHRYEPLSPKLVQILRRMLSANPDERFPTAEAVLEALQADPPPSDQLGGAIYGNPISDFSPAGLDQGTGNAFNLYALSDLGAAGAAGLAGAVGMAGAANRYSDGQPSDSQPSDGQYSDGDYERTQVVSITAPEVLPTEAMGYVDSAANESEVYEPEIGTPGRDRADQIGAKQALMGLLATLGLVSALLLLYALIQRNRAPDDSAQQQTTTADTSRAESGIEGEYSAEEIARRQAISSRRDSLGISEAYFTSLIDQLFYQEYPVLLTSGPNGGRKPLTSAPADEPLRIRWDNIATRVLGALDNDFSGDSLSELGTYSEASRDRWQSLIDDANVSDRAFNDLVDAKFLTLFPEQSGRDFLAQPVGQLYYALAEDRAQSISAGGVSETLSFAEGAFSQEADGQLSPGEGRIYLMSLSAGQLLRLNLNAPAQSTQISLYPPAQTDENPAVFADSEQTTWSGALTQTGVYELVVVNRSNGVIDYDLTVSVDKVTSAPVAPPAAPTNPPANSSDGEEVSGQNSQSPNGTGNTNGNMSDSIGQPATGQSDE
jgi:serine/threonine protein kinase, bacterial